MRHDRLQRNSQCPSFIVSADILHLANVCIVVVVVIIIIILFIVIIIIIIVIHQLFVHSVVCLFVCCFLVLVLAIVSTIRFEATTCFYRYFCNRAGHAF